MLRAKLFSDQVAAMKQRDAKRLEVLRFINARIKNREIDEKRELAEEEVLQMVQKYVRELDEAIEMAKKANRQDLIDTNQEQKDIAQTYLPAQLTDEELAQEVARLKEENPSDNPKAIIGVAMKALRGRAAPERIMAALNA